VNALSKGCRCLLVFHRIQLGIPLGTQFRTSLFGLCCKSFASPELLKHILRIVEST
jgi:hypothetical protein